MQRQESVTWDTRKQKAKRDTFQSLITEQHSGRMTEGQLKDLQPLLLSQSLFPVH